MMRVPLLTGLALAGVLLSGCYRTSPPLARDPLAQSPLGVYGEVSTPGHTYAGELLAVSSIDLTMLAEARVVVIPFAQLAAGDFRKIDVMIKGVPSARHFDQLRYASRFPYGIPASALRAILAQYSRAAVDTVK
jgi:hypothetical protein